MVIYVAILGNFQLVAATDTADRVSPKVAIVSPVATDLQLDFSLLTFGISLFPFLFFSTFFTTYFLRMVGFSDKNYPGGGQNIWSRQRGCWSNKLFTRKLPKNDKKKLGLNFLDPQQTWRNTHLLSFANLMSLCLNAKGLRRFFLHLSSLSWTPVWRLGKGQCIPTRTTVPLSPRLLQNLSFSYFSCDKNAADGNKDEDENDDEQICGKPGGPP